MDIASGAEKIYSALSDIQTQRQMSANTALNSALGYLQKQDYSGAIAQLRRVVALSPEHSDAYKYMAGAYAQLGKTDEAENTRNGLGHG